MSRSTSRALIVSTVVVAAFTLACVSAPTDTSSSGDDTASGDTDTGWVDSGDTALDTDTAVPLDMPADRCTFPDTLPSDPEQIRVGPSGEVYILGEDSVLRRFLPLDGDDCAFETDTSFYDGSGFLSGIWSFDLDGMGDLYTHAPAGQMHRNPDGTPIVTCGSGSGFHIGVTADGAMALVTTTNDSMLSLASFDGEGGCGDAGTGWEGPESASSPVATDGTTVYTSIFGAAHLVATDFATGQPQFMIGAAETTEQGALCFPTDVILRDDKVWVGDSNCEQIQVYDEQGQHVDRIDLGAWPDDGVDHRVESLAWRRGLPMYIIAGDRGERVIYRRDMGL